MKNIKEEALLWVRLLGFVAIWVAILYVTKTGLSINWEAVKKLPDVVTVYVILAFVFTKWLWRFPIFQGWLVACRSEFVTRDAAGSVGVFPLDRPSVGWIGVDGAAGRAG